ncbi:MAG: hypothetical protein ABR592_08325 [Nitriliruptorales bacterium]
MTDVLRERGFRSGVAVGGRWWRVLRSDWALGVHVLTLVVGLVVLVVASRGHWFVIDEWGFLTDRRLDDVRGLFAPHQEHWSTLPIVLWRALFAVVGLHSYWPYQLVALGVHLGVAHLLWRLQRRAQVAPGLAIATSGLFVVFGAGAENILNAFAMTFDASVLLGLGHVLLVDHPGSAAGAGGWGPPGSAAGAGGWGSQGRFDRRDAWGQVLALAGLMTSGVALSMVAVAGLTALLRRGWRAAAVTVGPPATAFTLWLWLMGRSSLGALWAWAPGRIPAFVWHGLTTTFDAATSVRGVGVGAMVALAVWLVRHRGELRDRLAATCACLLGTVIFFGILGIGRSMLSLPHAETSRYLYVAGALLIPAVGAALSDLAGERRLAHGAAMVLVVLLAANGVRLLSSRSEFEWTVEQQQRQLLLAASRLDLPPSELATMPQPVLLGPHLGYDELREIHQRGKLPSSEDVTRDWELAALTLLKISTSRGPLLPPGPQEGGPSVVIAGPAAIGGDPDCLRFEPRAEPSEVVLHVPAPVALPLQTSSDAVGVFLRDSDGTRSRVGLLVRLWHAPNYLNLHLHQQDVMITLPAESSFSLCGLGGPVPPERDLSHPERASPLGAAGCVEQAPSDCAGMRPTISAVAMASLPRPYRNPRRCEDLER